MHFLWDRLGYLVVIVGVTPVDPLINYIRKAELGYFTKYGRRHGHSQIIGRANNLIPILNID